MMMSYRVGSLDSLRQFHIEGGDQFFCKILSYNLLHLWPTKHAAGIKRAENSIGREREYQRMFIIPDQAPLGFEHDNLMQFIADSCG